MEYGEKLVPQRVCVLATLAWETIGEAWLCQAGSGPQGVRAGGPSPPLQWSLQAHTCHGGKGGRTRLQGRVMWLDSHCGAGGRPQRAGSQGPLSRPGGQSARAQGRGP